MTRVANSRCREYVERRQPFLGSNLFAEWREERCYVVYSWGKHWPLYIWDAETERWFGNREKYSVSTNRHSSQACPHNAEITWLSQPEMIVLRDKGVAGLVRAKIEKSVAATRVAA